MRSDQTEPKKLNQTESMPKFIRQVQTETEPNRVNTINSWKK